MFSYCALSEYLIWWKYFIFCYIYSWKIKTKSGRLRLSFSEFDLESGAECSKEYLQVKILYQDPTETEVMINIHILRVLSVRTDPYLVFSQYSLSRWVALYRIMEGRSFVEIMWVFFSLYFFQTIPYNYYPYNYNPNTSICFFRFQMARPLSPSTIHWVSSLSRMEGESLDSKLRSLQSSQLLVPAGTCRFTL